jgi:SsrA-binding protein
LAIWQPSPSLIEKRCAIIISLTEIPTAKRVRKLLLHREEIDRLYGEAQVKGRALVVLKLYWKNGNVKAEVGVGIGKDAGDKRADLKKRAVDRETAREVARFNRKHA